MIIKVPFTTRKIKESLAAKGGRGRVHTTEIKLCDDWGMADVGTERREERSLGDF
jgi:hypothetical protein